MMVLVPPKVFWRDCGKWVQCRSSNKSNHPTATNWMSNKVLIIFWWFVFNFFKIWYYWFEKVVKQKNTNIKEMCFSLFLLFERTCNNKVPINVYLWDLHLKIINLHYLLLWKCKIKKNILICVKINACVSHLCQQTLKL